LIEPGKNNNRLTRTIVGANTPITEPYTHDAHGNMTSMPHLPLMQWDFKDQLHATSRQVVNDGTPETTFYVYDGAGQRVRKVTERQAASEQTPTRKNERAYLEGFEVFRKYDASGTNVTLERETLHVMDDTQGIALVETRTQGTDSSRAQLIRYQFVNHLRSASLELDAVGQVISYEEYYPFGSTSYQAGRSAAEVSLKRYRYTGTERDEESGFSYHGARYYPLWLGRWVTADPIGIIGGINLYLYADHSPVNLIDPQGLEPKKPPVDPPPSPPPPPPKPKRSFQMSKAVGRAYDKTWFEHFNSRSDVARIIRQSRWKNPATGKSQLVQGRWRQPDLAIEFNTAPGRGMVVEIGAPPSFAGAYKMGQAAQDASAISRGLVLGKAEPYLHIEGRFEARGLPVVGDGGNVPGSRRVLFHQGSSGPKGPSGAKGTPPNSGGVGKGTPASRGGGGGKPTGVAGSKPVGGVVAVLSVVSAVRDIASDAEQGNYFDAGDKTVMTGLSFTPAAPLVLARAIIEQSRDPKVWGGALAIGDDVEEATGSNVLGAIVATNTVVSVSAAKVVQGMAESVYEGGKWAFWHTSSIGLTIQAFDYVFGD
jgi:RHS repeat-associated protein